jgi:hypothetical protein
MSSTVAQLIDNLSSSTQVEQSRRLLAPAPERLAGRATRDFEKDNPPSLPEPQRGADREGERLEVLRIGKVS